MKDVDEGEDFASLMRAQGRGYGADLDKTQRNARRQTKVGKSNAQRKRSEHRKDAQMTFRTQRKTIDLLESLVQEFGVKNKSRAIELLIIEAARQRGMTSGDS